MLSTPINHTEKNRNAIQFIYVLVYVYHEMAGRNNLFHLCIFASAKSKFHDEHPIERSVI
jgi:hypothetical protein